MAQPSWGHLVGSTLEDVQIDLLQGIVTLVAAVMRSGSHSNRFSIEASGVTALPLLQRHRASLELRTTDRPCDRIPSASQVLCCNDLAHTPRARAVTAQIVATI